jgi:hypothetical protein
MSTSSLPDGDAQTSAFFGDCTPAEEWKVQSKKVIGQFDGFGNW